MLALTLNPTARWGYAFLAGALALLRVLGGVHYPSDALAGYAIGILSKVSFFIFRKFESSSREEGFSLGKAPLGHLSFCSKIRVGN